MTCGSPPTVPLAAIQGSSDGDNVTYQAGASVSYVCEGTVLGETGNTAIATCGCEGNWTNIPTCVGKCTNSQFDNKAKKNYVCFQ